MWFWLYPRSKIFTVVKSQFQLIMMGPSNQLQGWDSGSGEIGVKLEISRVKLEIPILEIGLADESELIL